MVSINFSDIAILNIKVADCCCIISGISRNEAINLMQNTNLNEKKGNIIKHKNLLSYIKMGKKSLRLGDIEIEKNRFYLHKSHVPLRYVDIEKVLVSKKISFGEKNSKYFIGYLYKDHKVKSLYIMLPKTSAYVKSYDGQTKWMYFLIEDDELLKNIILFGIKSALI